MNVPPSKTAPRQTDSAPVEATLASTPTASVSAAAAKARAVPMRRPSRLQSQTDGAAPRPTRIQITGSNARTEGVARTIATRNVAVIT